MSLNQGALLDSFDRALTTGDYYGSEHIQWDASGGNDLACQELSARVDFIALCKRFIATEIYCGPMKLSSGRRVQDLESKTLCR